MGRELTSRRKPAEKFSFLVGLIGGSEKGQGGAGWEQDGGSELRSAPAAGEPRLGLALDGSTLHKWSDPPLLISLAAYPCCLSTGYCSESVAASHLNRSLVCSKLTT